MKQHSETIVVWNYQNADCSLKNKFIVLFIIIIGTLSFPIRNCFKIPELKLSAPLMIEVLGKDGQ